MKAPPAANRAAAPMAPVLIGAQAPALLLDEAAGAPPPSVEVGVAMPEVKGTLEAEVAPAKATVVEEGLGVREVALGFRTLKLC